MTESGPIRELLIQNSVFSTPKLRPPPPLPRAPAHALGHYVSHVTCHSTLDPLTTHHEAPQVHCREGGIMTSLSSHKKASFFLFTDNILSQIS